MMTFDEFAAVFPEVEEPTYKSIREALARSIDQTFLSPVKGEDSFAKFLTQNAKAGFKTLCVSPFLVPLAVQAVHGTPTEVCSVVGFPLGTHSIPQMCRQARELVLRGVTELDMVMNVGQFKEGHLSYVFDAIAQVKESSEYAMGELAEELGLKPEEMPSLIFKVILETCYLTPSEICQATDLVSSAGVDFVKTSTGFGTRGASEDDIRLMASCIEPGVGIKASGGIRTLDDAYTMLSLGATRLGTSSGLEILEQYDELFDPRNKR